MRKLGMVLVLLACSRGPKLVGEMKTPVYPGAKLVDHEVAHSQQGDDFNNMQPYTSNEWKFESKASEDDILAFYTDKLPEAQRKDPEADEPSAGSKRLIWSFAGQKAHEVSVTVKGSTFVIFEDAKD